ncbi:hypothetical protein [Neptunomonas japonica]|uniref:hypothetical protein n=1 Tax=Neptunomonas japonica TaxID=417574 RepID=UPI00042683D2|nr:hypothetical protein [Neptunomonas japonica]
MNSDNEEKKTCYRAYCISHDWEGMSQHEEKDAIKDLESHKNDPSKGPHENTGITSYEC